MDFLLVLIKRFSLRDTAESYERKEIENRRFRSNAASLIQNIGRFAFLSTPLGDLGATYDDHLGIIGKRVVDFLLLLIELFSLDVTAEALRANIGWESAISLQRGRLTQSINQSINQSWICIAHKRVGLFRSRLRTLGTHYHPTLDPAVLWTPSNDTSRPIFSDSLNLKPPAPLHLRTLWRYTNAVIIIIIIFTLTDANRFLPHCMQCRRGLAMTILSVPSVLQSYRKCLDWPPHWTGRDVSSIRSSSSSWVRVRLRVLSSRVALLAAKLYSSCSRVLGTKLLW